MFVCGLLIYNLSPICKISLAKVNVIVGRFNNLNVSFPTYQPVYLDLILLLLSHVCGGDAKSRRAEAA